MTYMAACDAGVDILDTALSPFAWGTSQPPTESVVAALKGTPYDTGLDLEQLAVVSRYFKDIKSKYSGVLNPISEQIDTNVLLYQIPGGMLSNLVSQLKEQNALDRYDEVLEEMPKVRAELGYPPLVTPTSQIVGSQAVLNVLMGERYKVIPKEVKDYVRGLYGRPPSPISDDIITRIIGEEDPIDVRPADLLEPEYDKRKKEAEEMGLVKKEEDILTYILYPSIAPKFLLGESKEEKLAPAKQTASPPLPQVSIPTRFKVEVDNEVFDVHVEPMDGSVVAVEESSPKAPSASASSPGAVTCHMQGMILSVDVNIGDNVEEGDKIGVIEAMKMENAINSPHGGVVKEILIAEGDSVTTDDVIMIIE
jgi:pyruvate carboxylase subunit B